jgi:hypothetical protein
VPSRIVLPKTLVRWAKHYSLDAEPIPSTSLIMLSFPACHRISRLLDRVEDLGYGTMDQLVHERAAEVFDGFCLLAREVLFPQDASGLARANALGILTQG